MEKMRLRPAFRPYAIFLGGLIALILALAGIASLLLPDFGYLWLALAGILTAALLLQLLQRYYFHAATEYVVDDNEITEIKGFWAKDENHVPIGKVQDYTLDRSVVGKLLGLASIGIQTARAERGYEIILRAIPEKDAEALDRFLDAQAGSGKK
ncbi:MAG: PH domain-containing protein [Candidatus Micrarchaeota archaeon]|nr:PH domain-containing protein [Candidatus Micrarchaeota archaeon]